MVRFYGLSWSWVWKYSHILKKILTAIRACAGTRTIIKKKKIDYLQKKKKKIVYTAANES